MGIEKLAEEAAGAFAADKAVDALDPNAGILEKGAAMVAGFEGGGMLGDFVKGKLSGATEEGQDPQSQPDQGDDGAQSTES